MMIPRQAIVSIVLFIITLGILFGWKYLNTSSFDKKILTEYKKYFAQVNTGSGPCDYPPLGNPETEAQKFARECEEQVCQHNLDNPQDQWNGWGCVCKANCIAGDQPSCDAMNGTLASFICNPCLIPPEHPAGYGKKGALACTCGNLILDPGEECDSGPNNGKDGSTCTSDCKTVKKCGNGIVESPEECDAGSRNGETGVNCTIDCFTCCPAPPDDSSNSSSNSQTAVSGLFAQVAPGATNLNCNSNEASVTAREYCEDAQKKGRNDKICQKYCDGLDNGKVYSTHDIVIGGCVCNDVPQCTCPDGQVEWTNNSVYDNAGNLVLRHGDCYDPQGHTGQSNTNGGGGVPGGGGAPGGGPSTAGDTSGDSAGTAGDTSGNNSGSSGTGGPLDPHNPPCYPSNLSQTLNNPSIAQQCGGSCPERTFGSLVIQGTCASPSDSFDTKSNDIYTEVPVNDFGYASQLSQCSCVYLLPKASSSSSPFSTSSSSSLSSNGACAEGIGPNGVRQCGGTCPSGQLCGFWGDGSGPNVCGCKSFAGNGSSSSSSGGSSGTSASSISTTSSSHSSQSSTGTCGWSGQQCGGTCPSGTSCKLDSSGSSPTCVCAAPSGSCGFSGSQCGGTCQTGFSCKQIDAGCQCVVNPGQRCNPINNQCGGSCPVNQVCAQVTKELSLAQCTLETMGEECTTTHGERGVCGFAAGNFLTFECTRQDLPCRTYSSVGDVCTSNDEDGTCQRIGHSTELVCVKNKELTSAEWQDRPFDRPFCGCIPAGGSSGGTADSAGNAGTISGGGSTAQVAGGPAGPTGNSSGGSSGTSSVQSTSSSSGGSSGTSSLSSRGTSSSSSSGGGSSQSSRSTSSSSSSSGRSSQSSRSSSSSSSSSSGGSSQSSRSSSSSSSSSGGSTSGSLGSSHCGDAIKQSSEQCDNGAQNRDAPNSCRTNCTNARCGDKIVDAGEQCDDGNSANTDFCTTSCKLTIVSGGTCGDGILQPSRGEQCDMGPLNSFLPNQCRPNCAIAVCGDSTKDHGEECDDGNLVAHDGCSNFCLLDRIIFSGSAHPAAIAGGSGIATSGQTAGYIAGQNAGQTAGATAALGATMGQNATAGSVTGYSAGEIAGGQPSGQNGGYSAGEVSGYSAGGTAGGYTAGNPWGGNTLPTAIPPATQTQTGPGLVILIATGAAAGFGIVRRRVKTKLP